MIFVILENKRRFVLEDSSFLGMDSFVIILEFWWRYFGVVDLLPEDSLETEIFI